MRRRWILVLIAIALIAACTDRSAVQHGLRRSAYVWQRQWTSAVSEAVKATSNQLDAIVALGAEFEWNSSTCRVVESNIDWDALRLFKRCGIALRVTPATKPQDMQHFPIAALAAEARKLLAVAKNQGINIAELQLDFDCSTEQLFAYARSIAAIRAEIQPARLVVTTLPAWLDSEAFPLLLSHCDSYVLQVHSVRLHNPDADWKICDAALARRWVTRAATYKKPFAVALPTYRCIAGYTPAGKLLGLAMDSVQGRWPPDTKLCEIAADPDELADLVKEWQKRRPVELREVLWYRLPVESDARNWRFATLAAVSNGRRPRRQIDVVTEGSNPVDLAIRNNGEADERLRFELIVSSDQPAIVADALTSCSVELHETESIFTTAAGEALQLRPGETRNVGWLRFAGPANLRFQLVRR